MSAPTIEPTFEDALADVIVNTVKLAIQPLQARIEALEGSAPQADTATDRDLAARVKALEDRPSLCYGGVWEANLLYRAGALVTRQGSLWLAQHDTRSTPGQGESGWKLIVKAGGA